MLDEFRARELRPGKNVKGERTDDPTWLFLLPSLWWKSVAFAGTPPESAVELIRRFNPDVELGSDIEHAQLVLVTGRGRPHRSTPAPLDTIGSIAASTPVALFNLQREQGVDQDKIFRSLTESLAIGSVNALDTAPPGPGTLPKAGRATLVLPHGPAPASPARDRASRAAKNLVKRADTAIGGWVSHIRSAIGRSPGGTGPEISVLHPGGTDLRGTTAIVLPEGTDPLQPPAWLISAARRNSVDFSGFTWAIAPPRGYRSQKLLFFLRPAGDGPAETVVKLTQDPVFNRRLDNEVRLLRAVAALPDLPCVVPRVVFSDTVAGLSIVAETAVNGRPFKDRSSGRADCEFVAEALESITRLGVSSRHPVVRSEWQAMMNMVDDYNRLYEPAVQDASLLAECAASLLEHADALPLVVQHGDPGVWNLLVTEEGTVGFLDWENGELHGVPLWDLFAFVKTLGAWAARSAGGRYGPDVFEQQLLRESPFRQLLDRHVRSYCDALEVPPEAVQGLFVMSWVYQSLKEVTRLPVQHLRRGRNTQLVSRTLAAVRAGEFGTPPA